MNPFKRHLFHCFIFAMGTACSDRDDVDCSLVLCAPDQPISLQLIAGGADVLADGTYGLEDIAVSGENGAPVQLAIIGNGSGGPEALLVIRKVEWNPGSHTFTLGLGEDWLVELEVIFTSSTDPCCRQSLIIRDLTSRTAVVEEKSGYFSIILG